MDKYIAWSHSVIMSIYLSEQGKLRFWLRNIDKYFGKTKKHGYVNFCLFFADELRNESHKAQYRGARKCLQLGRWTRK